MNKMIYLLIAMLAIGLVVLPQTLSTFSGQHNFYDTTTLGATSIQIPCEKCHADINSELSQPGMVNSVHKAIGCSGCHVTIAPQKEGMVKGLGGNFHAAALPLCVDCHSIGTIGLDSSSINGSNEAHRSFVSQSNNSNIMRNENAACIACHTHISVNITWTRNTTMNFNAIEGTNNTHTWIVTNFSVSGINTTHTTG